MENTITKAQEREPGFYWVKSIRFDGVAQYVNERGYKHWEIPGWEGQFHDNFFSEIDSRKIEFPSQDQTEILNECLEALENLKLVVNNIWTVKPVRNLDEILAFSDSCISKLKNLLGQPETKNDTE